MLACLALGCPRSSAVAVDGSVAGDPDGTGADGNFAGDDDTDWLCNGTELGRGTSPAQADTDGDGFSDYVEVAYGFDPLLATAPDRDAVHYLRENPEATLQIPIEHVVSGLGESYSGAVEDLPASDLEGLTARDFYSGTVAVLASPPDNVVETQQDAARFVHVTGRTRLVFEARFAFGDSLARLCARAYPFRYVIKRDDGVSTVTARHLLVVLPVAGSLSSSEWCAPAAACI